MQAIEYWKEKGFNKIATIFTSDRLKQGVDVTFEVIKADWKNQPGVYLMCSDEGNILKIGQSANILHRVDVQYKCISNLGNNRIRKEIKENTL